MVSVRLDPQMCVCTLLIYTAFVLGTTPKGDTGEGPNWACKRDSPGNSNNTGLSASDRYTPYAVHRPPSDSFCSVGLQSLMFWLGFFNKLVWVIDVNWENLELVCI